MGDHFGTLHYEMSTPEKLQDSTNFHIFRECLSAVVLRRGQEQQKKKAPKKRRSTATRGRSEQAETSQSVLRDDRENPEDVAEFIDVGTPDTCDCSDPGGRLPMLSHSSI